jgi:predicted extracellular nuclease
MKSIRIILIIWLFFLPEANALKPFRAVFYNVENLFDYFDDTLKQDEEYLPGNIRGWNSSRYYSKLGHISRVVSAIGENRFPELIGLAEVENDRCLKDLTQKAPLKNAGYHFVHLESEDQRGVDVALLYNPYRFSPSKIQTLTPRFINEPNKKTRDVLYVRGLIDQKIELHVFVCHYPSRLGGDVESETYRRQVSVMIRAHIDSLFQKQTNANILVMGDFNDYPEDKSIAQDLHAVASKINVSIANPDVLVNALPLNFKKGMNGTLKHQNSWGILDQMMFSQNLYKHISGVHILQTDFLLQPDVRWLGKKPFRTYSGYQYIGGYSDHLPIWVDMLF